MEIYCRYFGSTLAISLAFPMRFVTFIALCLYSGSSFASESRLVVSISDLRNLNGSIRVALHDSADHFPDQWEQAVQTRSIPATEQALKVVFEPVMPGKYAVIVIHDENNNRLMDKNFIGYPKEGFGASNNPTFFGPPRYSSATFDITSDTEINIRVKYF